MNGTIDIIDPLTAGTLAGLFRERVRRTPHACAYKRLDAVERCCEEISWIEVQKQASCWQDALRRENLQPGDRVGIMLKNSLEWVLFDLAALGLGLVTVPLFVNDRPENFTYIIEQTGVRLLLIEGIDHWQMLEEVSARLTSIQRIVSVHRMSENGNDPRLTDLDRWLPESGADYSVHDCHPNELASIVYTSGTTGNPKGVMLSHDNILQNAFAGLQRVTVYTDDLFLSFLPLSHTLERTAGYYIPMMTGASVAHVRSIDKLPEDLLMVRPTVLVSVPRIFERVHTKIMAGLDEKPAFARHLFFQAVNVGWKRFLHRQGRAGWTPLFLLWPLLKKIVADKVMSKLGGRMRLTISGGAPLAPPIARVFIGLGLNLLQGYGLTETSPIVSVNTLEENFPATVGRPLPAVEVKTADNGELLVKGPNLMLGYWQDKVATDAAIDGTGWFHTGDQARIEAGGQITITGRLKEIIVLSTGEKIPPADLEIAISVNHLFEQVLVIGEGRPYLSALVVLNEEQWKRLAARLGIPGGGTELINSKSIEEALLAEIGRRIARFPGYAQIRRVHASLIPWQINDGLITATLKLRREALLAKFEREVESLYAGH